MFRPLNDSVVVEPVKSREASDGGVILPEGAQSKYYGLRAVVVAVGPGPWTIQGTRLPVELSVGDVVILRNAGPLISEGGKVFCIVSERDVLAVVEGTDTVPCHDRRFAPALAR